MQVSTLRCGDNNGGRSRPPCLRYRDPLRDVQCACDVFDRRQGMIDAVRSEIVIGDRDSQALPAAIELWQDRFHASCGTNDVVRIRSLHRIIERSEVTYRARHRPNVVEARGVKPYTQTTQAPESWLQSEKAA